MMAGLDDGDWAVHWQHFFAIIAMSHLVLASVVAFQFVNSNCWGSQRYVRLVGRRRGFFLLLVISCFSHYLYRTHNIVASQLVSFSEVLSIGFFALTCRIWFLFFRYGPESVITWRNRMTLLSCLKEGRREWRSRMCAWKASFFWCQIPIFKITN